MSRNFEGSGRNAVWARVAPWLRVASVLVTGLLAACDYLFPPPPDRSPRIDVYADHFEYRFSRYETIRALRIALEASNEQIGRLFVQDCHAEAALTDALDLLRARGEYNFTVTVVPEDCPAPE